MEDVHIAPSAPRVVAHDRTELERRHAAYLEIGKRIAAGDELARVLALIGRATCELLAVDAAAVLIVEDEELVVSASIGLRRTPEPARWTVADSRVGRVVRTAQLQATSDLRAGSDAIGQLRDGRPCHSALDVPVMLRGDVVAVVCALHGTPRMFSADDANVLTSLAAHAAIALEHAALRRSIDALGTKTQTLLAVTDVIGVTLEGAEAVRRIAREAARAVHADCAAVYSLEPDGRALHPVAGYRVPKDLVGDLRELVIPLDGAAVLARASAGRDPLGSNELLRATPLDEAVRARFAEWSCAFVPMVLGATPVGALLVFWWSGRAALACEDVRLLEGIARQTAIVLDHARLDREVETRKQETEMLATIGRELSQNVDLDQVVDLAMRPLKFLGDSAKLYWELTARNAELKETTRALEKAVASRSEFLANVSHEIRSPLNSILGLLRLVIDGLCSPEEQSAFVAEAHANAQHLLTLLNDILDMAKIEAEKLETCIEPLDLVLFLADVRDLVQAQVEAKGLVFTVEPPSVPHRIILTDVQRLRQVMLNVIGNSIKFTERGSIAVRAAADAAAGLMRIDVVDTGIGVPLDVQARLFQKFVQADGTMTRRYGGSGLGLALSKQLVELMSGSMTLRSDGAGHGTTVTISLPLASMPVADAR